MSYKNTGGTIPREAMAEVRARTDIVEVISQYLSLTKAGQSYKALCPFHREKTPSFIINPGKQIFHCFGCGEGGNVFSFLMKYEGLTFPEAVRREAQRLHISLPVQKAGSAVGSGEKSLTEKLLECHQFAASFYHNCLLNSPAGEAGRRYLAQRGITQATITKFQLGYAPPQWDSLIRAASKKDDSLTPSLLQQAGLCCARADGQGYFDRWRDRIIFPIHNLRGETIAFGARLIKSDDEGKEPKYLNSPETALYKKGYVLYGLHQARGAIQRAGRTLVVEGYFDLLRLHQCGFESAVATLGTAFTPAQGQLLRRYTDQVIMIYDGDLAGKKAAGRGAEILLGSELEVRVATLPPGQDPDEFLAASPDGSPLLEKLIRESLNYVEFYLDHLLSAERAADLEGRVKAAQYFLPILNQLNNEIRREAYIGLIARKLGLSPDSLWRELKKLSAASSNYPRQASGSLRSQPKEEDGELELVDLLVYHPLLIAEVREKIELEDINSAACRQILHWLFQFGGQEDFSPVQLFDMLSAEEPNNEVPARKILSAILAKPIDHQTEELPKIIALLQRRRQKRKLREIKAVSNEAEQLEMYKSWCQEYKALKG